MKYKQVLATSDSISNYLYVTVNMKTVEEVEKAMNKFNGYVSFPVYFFYYWIDLIHPFCDRT
jgi:hypothetical protein